MEAFLQLRRDLPQVVIDSQDGTEPHTHQASVLERDGITPATAGLRLSEAHEVLAALQRGIGHDVLDLYATGHATTGTPMDEWDRPHGLDLWDLVDVDEQWTSGPAQVGDLRPAPVQGAGHRGRAAGHEVRPRTVWGWRPC